MSNSIIGKFPVSILNPILMKNIPAEQDEDAARSCHHVELIYCFILYFYSAVPIKDLTS